MSLIRCTNLQISFGGEPILNGVELTVEKKDRICLLGRNGSGKSTLLKVLMGELQADEGAVFRKTALKVAYLGQALPLNSDISVYD